VVLQVWPGRYADMPQLPPRDEMPDLLQSWSHQTAMLAADGARPFQAGGVVTAVGREASGTTVVDVDARLSLDDPWPSLARVIW
ncbi:intracellular growth attenuator igaA, partial [Paraburkholderia sp. SIMBA_009]